MADLHSELFALSEWDYALAGSDGWTLRIAAGSPLHLDSPACLIEFSGVQYIRCAAEFHHARFRLPTESELAEASAAVALEPEDHVFAFDAETSAGLESRTFIIVAESCSVTRNTQGRNRT